MSRRRPPAAIVLQPYRGSWEADDPHANFKREVAAYSLADPLETLSSLSTTMDIPVGALAQYVLVKWAAEGSEALLALGPRTVERLWRVIADAEDADTDEGRLAAYEVLRQMVSWLRAPLDETPSES